MPIVNGHPAECGCYVEGHWGQYGPDHLADQAAAFGWEPEKPTDDPRVIRVFADELENGGYASAASMLLWEWHSESADDIEAWLNEHTVPGWLNGSRDKRDYTWHWHDGEFFLSPICENGDCDDDTCAHWD